MLEIMPMVSVEDAMVKILNENLTDAEMQEMIVFYTSPVGIKLIELAPTFRAEKRKGRRNSDARLRKREIWRRLKRN
jgi:hypothetical protein